MYIWKIEPLIDDLKNNNLSQKEQLKYTLVFSILMLISSDPVFSVGVQYSTMDTISSFILLIMTIGGLLLCYRNNAKADNKDFILRFFTLGLPITVRFITIIFPVAIVAGILEAALDPSLDLEAENTVTTIYQVILVAAAVLAYYVYFASIFKRFTAVQSA